ncbi:MAG: hypothetical protein Q9160_005213 [Pyrenula sp. 1 TL-2023]
MDSYEASNSRARRPENPSGPHDIKKKKRRRRKRKKDTKPTSPTQIIPSEANQYPASSETRDQRDNAIVEPSILDLSLQELDQRLKETKTPNDLNPRTEEMSALNDPNQRMKESEAPSEPNPRTKESKTPNDPNSTTKKIRTPEDLEKWAKTTWKTEDLDEIPKEFRTMLKVSSVTWEIQGHVGQDIWQLWHGWLYRTNSPNDRWCEECFRDAGFEKQIELRSMNALMRSAWLDWRDWVFTSEAERELPRPVYHAFRSAFARKPERRGRHKADQE